MSQQEHQAVICVCVLAAFADGAQSEAERAQIQRIMAGFANEHVDLASAYQDVLGGKLSLAELAGRLETPSAKSLAYEMAVCVCQADGILTDAERQFLASLRTALQLDPAAAESHQQTAQTIVLQPLGPPPLIGNPAAREAEIDRLIMNAAILNGALEIMPHALATMAIIPLQMRMVYNIGARYGFQLDRGHLKDFLATVGIGLTSQVFEGFARQMVRGFARRMAGGLLGGLAGEAAGSAFAFATTYALGQVARRYYASGRTLSTAQLKETFSSMFQDARSMQGRYAGDIAARSRQVNVAELAHLASTG